MPSFLIDSKNIIDGEIAIAGGEAHHIQRVLRLNVGDDIALFDGAGYKYAGRIISRDRHQVQVKLLSEEAVADTGVNITLIQCLPRLDKMDLIVQKAVELGVRKIIPAQSRRTRGMRSDRSANKCKRWRRIAEEAAKQCGQAHLPVIEEARLLSALLENDWRDCFKIAFWEDEKDKKLKGLIRDMDKPDSLVLLIGAEGGFAPEEVESMRNKAWNIVGLGPRILRLETAAIVGLGIVQYELGDLS